MDVLGAPSQLRHSVRAGGTFQCQLLKEPPYKLWGKSPCLGVERTDDNIVDASQYCCYGTVVPLRVTDSGVREDAW